MVNFLHGASANIVNVNTAGIYHINKVNMYKKSLHKNVLYITVGKNITMEKNKC